MEKELKLSPEEVTLLRSLLETAVRSERSRANYFKSEPGRTHSSAGLEHGNALTRKEEYQRLLDRLKD